MLNFLYPGRSEAMMDNCIFCKIAEGKAPAYKIAESTNFVAFFDVAPNAEAHTLIIPKKHMTNFMEMPEYLGNEFVEFYQRVAAAVVAATHSEGFNLLVRNGPAAGQETFHLHFHLLPRKVNDGLTSFFGPHKKLTPEQFTALQQAIIRQMK
jgi:histidine triad (HIT) family protein